LKSRIEERQCKTEMGGEVMAAKTLGE